MKRTFKKTEKKIELVLDFIQKFISKNGYSPSIREIGAGIGVDSPSLIKYYLDKLEYMGKLNRGDSKRRIITLPSKDSLQNDSIQNTISENVGVFMSPVVGQVTAGSPILATQNITDYYPLPTDSFESKNTFMLKVSGLSMLNAGIFDGDYVIVNRQKHAENSEIVVAMWNDCATVKRYFNKGTYVLLHPANDDYNDIVIKNEESFEILGKVVGLLRKF